MPVIKSAIKKLRKDRRREKENDGFRSKMKHVVKNARKKRGAKTLNEAFAYIDKASKKHLIHKNKAARMKSRLSHLHMAK